MERTPLPLASARDNPPVIAIRRKREALKTLLGLQRDNAHADGRGALANMYAGYIIRVDAGRYDDRLDNFIAEARAELSDRILDEREEG
jgi:hypothetical protein